MSLKVDLIKQKEWLAFHKDNLAYLEGHIGDQKFNQSNVYHGPSSTAKYVGTDYLLLGDHQKAKEYFLKAFEYSVKEVESKANDPTYSPGLKKENSYNFPAMALTHLETSILTLDHNLMKKAVQQLDLSINVKDWPRRTKPWYCLDKAYSGLILNLDKDIRGLSERRYQNTWRAP